MVSFLILFLLSMMAVSLTMSWDRPGPVVAPSDLDPDLAHGAPPTGKLFPKPR